jgi:putative restriction endonuclease
MTQEFHTLFDAGFVSITPEYRVRVSPAIRENWSNGRRFYEYDGRPILVPNDPELRPSRRALEWHERKVFVA